MMSMIQWKMTEAGAPLSRVEGAVPVPAAGQVLIEIAGCGVCHTDLGFLYEGVRTRAPLPLTLGHEISGFVRAVGDGVQTPIGQAVIVPAVLPCGECPACLAGQEAICPTQFMPGNDGCGGFASHVVVPAAGLCPVPDCESAEQPLGAAGVTLRSLSVLADAASTAWQSIQRSGLTAGGTAVVVGAGGVGIYAVQIARAMGARVVAIDRDPARLEQALAHGAELALQADEDRRELRRKLRAFVSEEGQPFGVRVFECSGSDPGQVLAFDLLGPAGVLMVVGYTADKVTLRFSRLMALDARAIGNWGCAPQHYPPLLNMVLSGDVAVTPLVREFPLAEVQEVLEAVRRHELVQRPVLVPGA